jgi:hypothetical protein
MENIDQPFIFHLMERIPAVTSSDIACEKGILVAILRDSGDRQPVGVPENGDFNCGVVRLLPLIVHPGRAQETEAHCGTDVDHY